MRVCQFPRQRPRQSGRADGTQEDSGPTAGAGDAQQIDVQAMAAAGPAVERAHVPPIDSGQGTRSAGRGCYGAVEPRLSDGWIRTVRNGTGSINRRNEPLL